MKKIKEIFKNEQKYVSKKDWKDVHPDFTKKYIGKEETYQQE